MKFTKSIGWTLTVTALTGIFSLPAVADLSFNGDMGGGLSEHEQGRMYAQAGGGGWRGGVQYFDTSDNGVWHTEYWQEGMNNGVPGGWWVVRDSSHPYPRQFFYTYNYPVTYQPPPPQVVQSLPPNGVPVQYWYYCLPTWGFNPFMPSCMVTWRRIQ